MANKYKTYAFNYVETVIAAAGSVVTIELYRQLNKEINLRRFSYSWYGSNLAGYLFPQLTNQLLVTITLRYSNGRLTDEIQPGNIVGGAGTVQPYFFMYEPREYNFQNIPVLNNLQIVITMVNRTANNTDFYIGAHLDLETEFKYQ